MNNWFKMVIGNVVFIAVAIILYSPVFIGLRLGVDAIQSALCISIGVAGVLTFFLFNGYMLIGPEIKVLENHESTLQELKESLEQLPEKDRIKKHIKAAIDQISRWYELRDTYTKIIKARFGHTSLTSSKYEAVLDRMEVVLRRNIALVYNKGVLFKEKEYRYLASGAYTRDEIPDDIQEQSLEMYEQTIETIKDAVASNETVLLQLDTLMHKVTSIEPGDNEAVEEEVRKLGEELEYYEKIRED